MTDVRQLLTALQFADSAFPSGFYTMSHSLEGYSQARLVGRDGVQQLLGELLLHAVGPSDATALAAAHRAAADGDVELVQEIDQRLFASKLNAEMRTASVRSGHQLIDLGAELTSQALLAEYRERVRVRSTPGCQPVAAAVVYAANGVDARDAVAADLFAFSASFVGAALRLRLTDHRQAQAILLETSGVIEQATDAALERDLADLGGCAPMADVMSARHERAEARLFSS
ncbi:urease accessory protein [Arthrobacter sp. zg-Y20]|uniref:urease accessory protein UreF n=1 Tax=unclassified Arthrobacter TaxID=235627 RepID=UPI001D139967|nr:MULTISPECIES: urease accessory UreF family protein [unclassified Arthrobacter]MCC3274372.1 urease accessory protein [Arthrobacter sp. zg-Y20]MDK1314528.1 urease accessory UreF family protein [Arthrobacter sp. zg.Y20]WIB07511.1 urease accessory UreF family protein [Arthrobacter sp. zg-Y20]